VTGPTNGVFSLAGRVAVVTGGGGVLGSAIASGLAQAGARVAVLGRTPDTCERVANTIRDAHGEAVAVSADVLSVEELQRARDAIAIALGPVDILVNAAGGNRPEATIGPGRSFFDLDAEAIRMVIDLNLLGTWLPIQVLGGHMAESGRGSIINVSSMAASKPLTLVAGYSVAKAGVDNLTRWLAVHVARTYGPGLRVNAIAPGFFVGDQNRALLIGSDGSLTDRGAAIIAHTPMARFGEPDDLVGTVTWLASDASRFVTGTVVAVDGGFGAFGGI
jgi:NAD(P)-dependent dehydrogenase (short-subunit alcohol dehydrogenase family)